MKFRVVKHFFRSDETNRGDDDERNASKYKRGAAVSPQRPGKSLELRPSKCFCWNGVYDGEHEKVELLDDESESDNGDASSHPGKKGSLVRGVISIIWDHVALIVSSASHGESYDKRVMEGITKEVEDG